MLRTAVTGKKLWLLWMACGCVGVLAWGLVYLGNPGNMGLCGACFLRDTAGALGLFQPNGPRIFRPELAGLVLGAFLLRLGQRRIEGRAGAHSAARFFLGMWTGVGALVFLGCPFRMLQRVGGGDLNAVVGLVGFILGAGAGLFFEKRGYTSGKTAVVVTPAGMVPLVLALGGLLVFLVGEMPFGPAPADTSTGPPHAPWFWALGLAMVAGALLSLTGFCAVTAARQVYAGPRRMLWGAVALIAAYAVGTALSGQFKLDFTGQPASHSDHLWNVLAMALVGLTGVLAGGCPVRQVVLCGEGNGDAMITAAGILAGCCLAHTFQLVSSPSGTTFGGRLAVLIGLGLSSAYAVWVTAAVGRPATAARQ